MPEVESVHFRADRIVGQSSPAPIAGMQILVVVHGSGSLHAQGQFLELGASDIVAVRPGVPYELRHCHALQLIVGSFSPRQARALLGGSFDHRALTLLLSAKPTVKFNISAERFRSLVALLSVATGGGEMGNLGRLLILLETIVEAGMPTLPKLHPAVLKTIQRLEEDLAKDWILPDLASSLNLDPSYLARIFKKSVGAPPIAYLAAERAEEAAELLLNSPLSCAAVGNRVGWTDPNYFSRRFRQHFGQSPTAYREMTFS